MSQSTGASKKKILGGLRRSHLGGPKCYMCKMKVALFPSNGKYSDLNTKLRLGGLLYIDVCISKGNFMKFPLNKEGEPSALSSQNQPDFKPFMFQCHAGT